MADQDQNPGLESGPEDGVTGGARAVGLDLHPSSVTSHQLWVSVSASPSFAALSVEQDGRPPPPPPRGAAALWSSLHQSQSPGWGRA